MELLRNLTIKKFHEGLLNKDFSALEITQASFKHIKEHDGFDHLDKLGAGKLTAGHEIGAFLSIAEESAIREAEAVDLAVLRP